MSIIATSLKWSTESVNTGARNKDFGMTNMDTIKTINPDLSRYPAFRWCADYGADWYLPALNELRTIDANMSKLNATLSKVGGTLLEVTDYWSSTEESDQHASALRLDYDDYVTGDHKSYKDNVRAVRAL